MFLSQCVYVSVCVCACIHAFVGETECVCFVRIMQVVSRSSSVTQTLWNRERQYEKENKTLVFLCHILLELIYQA